MNNIKVSHSELGTITAESSNEIRKEKKNIIKSLAFLQITCMVPDDEEDEHYEELLDILTTAANRARDLYYKKDDNGSNALEQF